MPSALTATRQPLTPRLVRQGHCDSKSERRTRATRVPWRRRVYPWRGGSTAPSLSGSGALSGGCVSIWVGIGKDIRHRHTQANQTTLGVSGVPLRMWCGHCPNGPCHSVSVPRVTPGSASTATDLATIETTETTANTCAPAVAQDEGSARRAALQVLPNVASIHSQDAVKLCGLDK